MEKIDLFEKLLDFKGNGKYTDEKLFMSSPLPITVILISYLWFVLKFGPEFMKKRKPFQFTNVLIAYNFMQVLLSSYMFCLGFKGILDYGLWHKTCYCQVDHLREQVLDGAHLYFTSKVIELLDTVFFVLRKKQNQVTFLHVYHHTLMVIATWSIVKYSQTDSCLFLGTINSLVHIVMYAYYGLSVFPALTKYLWWKKYITMIQLVQFCMMFLHIIISHYISDCKPAYILLFSVCSNTILFLYLFGKFYLTSYTKTKKHQTNNTKITDDINEDKLSMSCESKNNGLNYLMNNHKLAAKIN